MPRIYSHIRRLSMTKVRVHLLLIMSALCFLACIDQSNEVTVSPQIQTVTTNTLETSEHEEAATPTYPDSLNLLTPLALEEGFIFSGERIYESQYQYNDIAWSPD